MKFDEAIEAFKERVKIHEGMIEIYARKQADAAQHHECVGFLKAAINLLKEAEDAEKNA